ncbi:MBL fold metallo-hydrolase [Lentisphaerota bacterium WC36G]|nr:MBL fold metallo-hydrolase [Lentisphaerae bacterium WC36]
MNSVINKELDFTSCKVYILGHAQGCRSYCVVDKNSSEAMIIDCHLDFVYDIVDLVVNNNLRLNFIVDTHTHADHPSGALLLTKLLEDHESVATRIAHEKAQHQGVEYFPKDGEVISLGNSKFTIKHTPGHTPDHIVIYNDEMLFSGDTLLINSIARTDFLGGDAGQLFDSLQYILNELSNETTLLPGHDYNDQISSTLGKQKTQNSWLKITEREKFIDNLVGNKPPRPANMDMLLKLNRQGVDIAKEISVESAQEFIKNGGHHSVLDVRTAGEHATEKIANSVLIPVDDLEDNLEKVMAIPAPRLIMCQSGSRAQRAQEILEKHHIAGTMVINGGMNAYKVIAENELLQNKKRMSLERQVRIAAGFLVLLGIGLSFVHIGFIGISAFVGCGLIFAGITDYCGMAMILAKMPWNKVKEFNTNSPIIGGCSAGGCSAGGCSVTTHKDED